MGERPTGWKARVHRADTPDLAAAEAASVVAEQLVSAVGARGVATLALSGGRTPRLMVEVLATLDVPWPSVHLLQVDERAVPAGDLDRNWRLLQPVAERLPEGQGHPMPVEQPDADVRYAAVLEAVCGRPAVLDVVQLGLGGDGHTASLPPGDPVVDVADRDVAWSGEYAGHRRLTLTLPALNRARSVVWLVTGAAKAGVLRRLADADPAVVASRVVNTDQLLVADVDAVHDLQRG